MSNLLNYNIFFEFYDAYNAKGFKNINPKDGIILKLEKKLESTGQFFHVADLIQLQIFYCCRKCHAFFGIMDDHVDPSIYFNHTHPDEIKRFGLARAKVFKMASDMYLNRKEMMIISSNYKTRNASGEYFDILYQLCLLYTESPHKTVYSIQVCTDVSKMLSTHHGYHYYLGDDISQFRYPDPKLLMTGNVFSKREFEIIKSIAEGLDSKEIADKLFLSVHTVNTHRRNILEKTMKRNTHELVIELQDRGMI